MAAHTLRKLNLSNNRLRELKPEIKLLSQLTALDVAGNNLSSLPPELGSLTGLLALTASQNKLAIVPDSLARLTRLGFLDLGQNKFGEFPSVILALTSLRHLYFEHNLLKQLPPQIGTLTNLETLSLTGNRLSSLPAETGRLHQLHQLNLRNNQLTDLPKELGSLNRLAEAARQDSPPIIYGAQIDGNPLPHPYPLLINQGQPETTVNVLAWLRGELDIASIESVSAASNPEELSETEIEGALEQRPASFRFGMRGGKIDALPEQPTIIDIDVAKDLQSELLSKARVLETRLQQTNSDPRVRSSTARLISELEKDLGEIRPGVLLSRSRSIEADRNAFDSEDARRELFPDAIAVMDDVLLSLQDLMAIFPVVREIEAERVALSIQGDITSLDVITENAKIIKDTASASEIVTRAAANALNENDIEIRDARGIVVQARLVADQLLVIRNFAGGAALSVRQALSTGTKRAALEIGELGSKSWDQVKTNLPEGIGAASRALPIVALIGLLATISGPIAGIAGAAAAFKPLSTALKKIIESAEKAQPKTEAKQETKRR